MFPYLWECVEKAEFLYPDSVRITLVDKIDFPDIDLGTMLSSLTAINDDLFDLISSLETIPTSQPRGHRAPHSIEADAVNASHTDTVYLINVRDKFPKANELLLHTLAKLNWTRHELIRKISQGDEIEDPDFLFDSAETAKVSGYQTMSKHNPCAILPSSNLSTGDNSSFGNTTIAEDLGRTRYPPPPVELGPDIAPFECTICHRILDGCASTLDWRFVKIYFPRPSKLQSLKPTRILLDLSLTLYWLYSVRRKHIIKDIRPYICSFTECKSGKVLYHSRKAWMNHEFSCHRNSRDWVCVQDCGIIFESEDIFYSHLKDGHHIPVKDVEILAQKCCRQKSPPLGQKTTCPLCLKEIPESRRSLQRHIGKHMEEIALTALPPEVYQTGNSTEESDSERSSGFEQEKVLSPRQLELEEVIIAHRLHILKQLNELFQTYPV